MYGRISPVHAQYIGLEDARDLHPLLAVQTRQCKPVVHARERWVLKRWNGVELGEYWLLCMGQRRKKQTRENAERFFDKCHLVAKHGGMGYIAKDTLGYPSNQQKTARSVK